MTSKINHFTDLGEVLKILYKGGKHSDAILNASGKEFAVHRVLLSAQSTFFDKLLYGNKFSEGETTSIKIGAPPDLLELVLKYFYTGQMDLEDLDIEEVIEILELSRLYDLHKLETSLIDRIEAITDIHNLHLVIRVADLFESHVLKEKCIIVLNVTDAEFFNSKTFLFLTQSELVDIMSADKLNLTTIEKFQAISKWIDANPDCDKNKILKCIDLSRLTNEQLDRFVAPTNLIENLSELVSSRKTDVDEETKMVVDQFIMPPERGTKIVVGGDPQHLCSLINFVEAETINGIKEIIVDLGQLREINCLRFHLGERTCYIYDYSIKFSSTQDELDSVTWIDLRQFNWCRGQQKVYFETTNMRFIRIQGIEKLNKFEAFKTIVSPDMEGHFISPKTNIFKSQNAIVVGSGYGKGKVLSQNAINWNFQGNGVDTTFTESDVFGSIRFCLNQPFFLRQCRFRLWDFDGVVQSFKFHAWDADKNGTLVKRFVNATGWHTVELEPKAYTELYFLTVGSSLKIVYFEATA